MIFTKNAVVTILLACLGLVLNTTAVHAGIAVKKKKKKKTSVDVFILAGQSNAVGFNNAALFKGGLEQFDWQFIRPSTVLFWAGSNARGAYANRWTALRAGVSDISTDAAYANAFGPEIGFAKIMQDSLPGRQVAILKYALYRCRLPRI